MDNLYLTIISSNNIDISTILTKNIDKTVIVISQCCLFIIKLNYFVIERFS